MLYGHTRDWRLVIMERLRLNQVSEVEFGSMFNLNGER